MVGVSTVEEIKKKPRKGSKYAAEAENATPETPKKAAESTMADQSSPDTPETAEIPEYPRTPRKLSFDQLCEYWNQTLNTEQRERGVVYCYRHWPILEPVETTTAAGNPDFSNPCADKFSHLDPPLSLELVLKRCGLGTYSFRLNQNLKRPYGTLTNARLDTDRDNWNEHMPIIPPDRKVDFSDPANERYKTILVSKGMLKATDTQQGAEEEMAATSVLGEIASKAFDKMGQPGPQVVQSDIAGGVGTELVGLLREQINVNRPPAQQGTVKEQLEGLVTLAKTMTPAPAPAADMGPYIELQRENNSLVRELMRKDVERAEAEASRAKEEAAQYRAALPQPKTVDEQWDELERAAKRFDRMTGKKEKPEEDEEEKPSTAAGFWGGLLGALPQIMKSGVELLREGNVMLYNYKLNGVGAVPLNPATGQPGTEPLAPAEGEDNEPALSPEDQARMDHMQNVANQLTALASPMLSHMARNKTGADFARFVIENYGPPAFALLQNTGKETIFAMIQNYPPVWNQIAPQRLPQFQKFLDEFIGYSAVAVQ